MTFFSSLRYTTAEPDGEIRNTRGINIESIKRKAPCCSCNTDTFTCSESFIISRALSFSFFLARARDTDKKSHKSSSSFSSSIGLIAFFAPLPRIAFSPRVFILPAELLRYRARENRGNEWLLGETRLYKNDERSSPYRHSSHVSLP